ncbi:LmeA family phospholipid-binding protein [Nocardia sp. CA-128927]|uniref:LmeA family phospholipid-binding protein n=1 Tax=Nocardia sp. CA-128927 TaxID=3239975 RepID=UPI003D98F629
MRKLIIGLLILAGLAVVIDFSVAAYSEYRVSRALRQGADLPADPAVAIRGVSFLAQAVDGRYDNIWIKAGGNRPHTSGEYEFETNLYGVRLPLRDLVDGSLRNVPVERVESSLRIGPTELGRLFTIPDLQVRGPERDKSDGTGGSGGSGMTTTGDEPLCLLGSLPDLPNTQYDTTKVFVQADLSIEGDQVKVVATGFCPQPGNEKTIPETAIPEPNRQAVLARFTRTIDIKELPFGVHPTKVSAQGGWIVVEGKGVNVTIDLDRWQRS